MNTDELKTVLESHQKWLMDAGGSRANLSGAYLYALLFIQAIAVRMGEKHPAQRV